MERIFPNLYRFTEDSLKRRKYSYLVVRKDGNLLMPSLGTTVRDSFDEIDKLGGVHAQFLTHDHDAHPELVDEAHARFGCRVYYHKSARKKVREKTSCPEAEFDNEGLQLGADFEALYFPGHTPGHSIFRWRYRGKRFLFSSHVMNLSDGVWELWFNPSKNTAQLQEQLADLAEVDYSLPTLIEYGREELHRFNDFTRESFSKAMQECWDNPVPYNRMVLKSKSPVRDKEK